MGELGHPLVSTLLQAVRHLESEAHLFTGFVRFSDCQGVLMGEIQPKNQVLPLVRGHFVQRYNTQQFLLYDRTHRQALVYRPGQWAIVPVEDLRLPDAGAEELRYRALWRQFFQTVAIRERYNPRCQNTHLPKRYRGVHDGAPIRARCGRRPPGGVKTRGLAFPAEKPGPVWVKAAGTWRRRRLCPRFPQWTAPPPG